MLQGSSYYRLLALLTLSLLVYSTVLRAEDNAQGVAFFEQKIRPLLVKHCYECHSLEQKKSKGGLTLDTRAGWQNGGDAGEPAIVPGSPDKSLLLKAVRHDDPDLAMPPKKPKLPPELIHDLTLWINMGAPDPRTQSVEAKRADKTWWSLQPLKAAVPPVPAGLPPSWESNPIDRFVFAALALKGLTPSKPAGKRALLRRITYDLTGLPPTPDELDSFERDSAPDAYRKVVERLLQSPRYGERWGRHWLDVIRFGESRGYERNEIIPNAWPFRDYVIRSFNDDKPFNRFIQEHLAGDVLGPGDPDVEIGTAFLTAGPYDDVTNQDIVAQANIRATTVDDMVSATGAAFLGLTINCARCHHHKFDPIPTEDYYRIKAAFDGASHGSRVLVSKDVYEKHASARRPLEQRRDALAKEKAALEKAEPAEQSRLPEVKAALDAVNTELKKIPSLPTTWLPLFKQPQTTVVFKGGDPMKPGDPVKPASLAVLDKVTPAYELSVNAPEAERRMALARWITENNPLTARVLANRIWQHHFGTGIVDTPSDFGYLGGKPTHPELLDWLALRLIEKGWRLKDLHRDIVLSQTYQQSAEFREDASRVDKDACLLWRFPPRRLSAEEIRDTYLAVCGKLNLKMGGPGFRLYEYKQDNVATYIPLEKHGPETYRRAVYHHNARASIVDLLSDFDLPDNAFAAPRRVVTTTPLQALTQLNHAFTLDMAQALASELKRADASPAGQLNAAFRRLLQRQPSPQEHAAALALIEKHGLPAFCRALLNANELLYLD